MLLEPDGKVTRILLDSDENVARTWQCFGKSKGQVFSAQAMVSVLTADSQPEVDFFQCENR